jgi:hypothetical protein
MVIVGVHTVWYWRRRPRRVRESTSGICRAYLSSTNRDREQNRNQSASVSFVCVQHAKKNKISAQSRVAIERGNFNQPSTLNYGCSDSVLENLAVLSTVIKVRRPTGFLNWWFRCTFVSAAITYACYQLPIRILNSSYTNARWSCVFPEQRTAVVVQFFKTYFGNSTNLSSAIWPTWMYCSRRSRRLDLPAP